MDNNRLAYLLDRYLAGTLAMEEKEELAVWVSEQEDEGTLKDALERAWGDYQPGEEIISMGGAALDRIEAGLFREGEQRRVLSMKTGRSRRWMMAAAVLVLVAGSVVYWFAGTRSSQTAAPVVSRDVAPGGNRAVLTLGNGSRVILDSAGQGKLAEQAGTEVAKLRDGQLEYMPIAK